MVIKRALTLLAAEGTAGEAASTKRFVGSRRCNQTHDGDVLSQRERAVAELVALGRRNEEVAVELGMRRKTVEGHLTRIYRKLGGRSRTELAVFAGRKEGGGFPWAVRPIDATHTNNHHERESGGASDPMTEPEGVVADEQARGSHTHRLGD